MTAKSQTMTDPATSVVDELDEHISESMQDPEFRAASEDVQHRYDLIEELVRLRKALGLTQKDIAARMSVGQSTVSGFETEGADPRLSTLQRYARAVEARCDVAVRVPTVCDWVTPASYTEDAPARKSVQVGFFTTPEHLRWAAVNSSRNDFALAS